jgi:hypothetical protein
MLFQKHPSTSASQTILLRACLFVRDGFASDVVTPLGFVLEQALTVDVLAASWRLPIPCVSLWSDIHWKKSRHMKS